MKKNNINVKVNPETGDVSIQESILFSQGSAELKPKGKAFLRKFIPIYSGVIFSKPEFSTEVIRVKDRERQIKLEEWEDEIEILEQEARDYCERIGFRIT